MKRLFFCVLCLGILFSCKKEKKTVETPAAPAVTTGSLSGHVTQYNQFGIPYTNGLYTTTVSVDSSNASCVTDQNGHYALPNMASGTYTLTFKKPGCGIIKLQGVHYKFSDTTTYNVSVAEIPVFSISTAYVKDTSWFAGTLPGIYYNASTSPVNSMATLVAIVGKSANITIADPSSYVNYAPASLINTTDYNRFLSYTFLKQSYQFKPDSVIYVKIYPIATTGASYFSNALNKPVYTAYGNTSATFTLTVPQ